MTEEKNVAFAESMNAMAAQALRANQALAASLLRSFWSTPRRKSASGAALARWQEATLGILNHGAAPIRRKAVANAKRLARTKLR